MSPLPTSLTGVLVALITPFTPDQKEIDFPALEKHINRLIDAGVHGLVPGGSTGEFTVLSTLERKNLLEACITYASGRVPIIAGISALSTSGTIDLGTHASQAGAAALMIVPPFYDALDLAQLKTYLSEIHQASGNLPIMYYNIPSASGLTLSPAEIASLADVGVRYMKDTSGHAPDLTEMLFHPGRKGVVTTFNGWDSLTFYGLAAGAKGTVWGATNFIPELSMQLWEALVVERDLVKGREVWSRIWPVCRLLEEGNYAGAVKTGMEIRGWRTGGLRKPFGLLEGERRARLVGLLRDAGVEIVE